jgi:hypothetical protein
MKKIRVLKINGFHSINQRETTTLSKNENKRNFK